MTDAEWDALIERVETYQKWADVGLLIAECRCLRHRWEAEVQEILYRLQESQAECARLRETIHYLELFNHKTPVKMERELRFKAEAALASAQALLSECAEHWASQRNLPPDSLAGRVRAAIAARKP